MCETYAPVGARRSFSREKRKAGLDSAGVSGCRHSRLVSMDGEGERDVRLLSWLESSGALASLKEHSYQYRDKVAAGRSS